MKEYPINYIFNRKNCRVQWQVVETDDSTPCIWCALNGKKMCKEFACKAAQRTDGKNVYVQSF